MKRFWKTVEIAEAEAGGWQVLLDTKPVRTPARHPCVVPSRAMAERIAAEEAAIGRGAAAYDFTSAAKVAEEAAAPALEALEERRAA